MDPVRLVGPEWNDPGHAIGRMVLAIRRGRNMHRLRNTESPQRESPARPHDATLGGLMQLRYDQLAAQLAKGLAPIYVVIGDEPLQHVEAADTIRRTARERGFGSREVFDAGSDFDWNRLSESADSLSLFAEQRLVDLRLPSGKPGREGGAALTAWAERPPEDTVLLLTLPKLEQQARRGRWFSALEKAGVVVQVWPIDADRLPQWLQQRMQAKGLQPTREAVALLAARVEGNLLAAAQEIDKLLLLGGPGTVDADRVVEVVADSSRWSVFDLSDALLAGSTARVGRIVAGLYGEGTPEPVIVWALQRELALLADGAERVAAGMPAARAADAVGVWKRRQRPFAQALGRLDVAGWQRLCARAARLERLAKGAAQGSFRDELLELALTAAGARRTSLSPPRVVAP
jgi:DNA polymerase-3 subunit delta